MRRSLLVTTLVLLTAAGATPASADPPFTLNGKNWKSQRAFVESGARCATRHVDEFERTVIDRKLAHFLARQGKGGGKAPGGGGGTPSTTPVGIPVYVHVLHNGVTGNVSDG